MAVVPVLARSCPLQGPVPPPLLACLGRGRPGLGSVPPCLGTRGGSHLGLLPLAPGQLAGGLLQLIHPLPGRREERRADQHHARKPQKPTDPDQQPSPDQQAAVELHAPRGGVVAHLHSSRRSEDGCTEGPVTSRHGRLPGKLPRKLSSIGPSLVPVRVILGCGWMLVILMLEQCGRASWAAGSYRAARRSMRRR